MSALLRKGPAAASAASGTSRGFGLAVDRAAETEGRIGGAIVTVLLVLYPALATVAIVVAAFLLSGDLSLA